MKTFRLLMLTLILTAALFGQAASMITPTPGTALPANPITFTWTAVPNTTQYWVQAGVSWTNLNYANSGALSGSTTSWQCTSMPTNVGTIYLKLWTLVNGQWYQNLYTYASYVPGQGTPAQITAPVPGSLLTQTGFTVQWTPGTNVTQYWLVCNYINGPNAGQSFCDFKFQAPASTAAVNGMVLDGSQIGLTLWSMINGQWVSAPFQYTSFGPSNMIAAKITEGATQGPPADSDDNTGGTVTPYSSNSPAPDPLTTQPPITMYPTSGNTASTILNITYANNVGPWGAYVLISSQLAFPGSCAFVIVPPFTSIGVLNEPGGDWNWATPGTGGATGNSRCSLNPVTSGISVSGTTITAHLDITFSAGFSGPKSIWTLYYDPSNQPQPNGAWYTSGSWTVPGGQDNQPMAQEFLTVKTSKGFVKIPRADRVGITKAESKVEQNGPQYTYTYTIDNRNVWLMRFGDIDHRPPVESTTPKGWSNLGKAFGYLPGAERSEAGVYTMVSEWKPGPLQVFAKSDAQVGTVPAFEKTDDNEAIWQATNLSDHSETHWVIGPVIDPALDHDAVKAKVEEWSRQFPFLADVLAGRSVDESKLSRFERQVLKYTRDLL